MELAIIVFGIWFTRSLPLSRHASPASTAAVETDHPHVVFSMRTPCGAAPACEACAIVREQQSYVPAYSHDHRMTHGTGRACATAVCLTGPGPAGPGLSAVRRPTAAGRGPRAMAVHRPATMAVRRRGLWPWAGPPAHGSAAPTGSRGAFRRGAGGAFDAEPGRPDGRAVARCGGGGRRGRPGSGALAAAWQARLRRAGGGGPPRSPVPPPAGPASHAASGACRTPSCPWPARSRSWPGRP